MNFKIISILFLFVWASISCSKPKEWQELEYVQNLKCDSLHAEDAMHTSFKCKPYFENDTLVVRMSGMSWEHITIKIHNGKFKAELGGVPFAPVEFSFQTKRQRLQVGKELYAINDTLCGYFDFLFQLTDVNTNKADDWSFKGFICEVIREKDFDPFAKENFMNFDLPTAIHEMGEPLDLNEFNMYASNIHEFRVELLNYLPSDKPDIEIKELTWDVSPTREISDEGQERLTIWYVRKQYKVHFRKNGYYILSKIWDDETKGISAWLPLHSMVWNTNYQY